MKGFDGFDYLQQRLVVETCGFEWTEQLYRQLKFVEDLFLTESLKEQ